MNGIIVIDKPAGFTSFDVVAKMRGILGTRKIGHGGTLDPMATGVLPVFVGGAAKAVDMQPDQDKTYEAVFLLGTATDTGDITGAVLETGGSHVGEAALAAVLHRFSGPQSQVPPMYSAVKVDGRPLYKYARAGVEVQRKSRDIVVHEIERLGPEKGDAPEDGRVAVRVRCSKGTYIRVLAEDMGKALGTCATLYALRRTAAGVFSEAEAHTLEAAQAAKDAGGLAQLVLPVERLFRMYPAVMFAPEDVKRLLNGAAVRKAGVPAGLCRAVDEEGFLGLAKGDGEGNILVEKLFRRD